MDPYAVLGLEPGATSEEITKAYRKLTRRYPPELSPRRFARIQQAHHLLSSSERRMKAAARDPEATLAALDPVPRVTLAAAPPAPAPPAVEDCEPLLAAVRRALLEDVLRAAFSDESAR